MGGQHLFKHYLHAFIDNKRWDHYLPRENDIVIATPFRGPAGIR